MENRFADGDRVVVKAVRGALAGCSVAVGDAGTVELCVPDRGGDILVRFDGCEYSLYANPLDLELEDQPQVTNGTLAIGRLFAAMAVLGPRALEVLTAVAERLAKGASEHGDFPNLERDWERESLEEQLDDLVYRTVKQLRSCGRL